MSEHYFLVKYDPATGWEWDTETESAHFTDGTIYVDGAWLRSGDLLDEAHAQHKLYDVDEQASEALGKCLMMMNGNNLPPKDGK